MKRSIPILLYHHVSPDREITPQALEAQLSWMLGQGFRSLSISELLRVLSGEPREQPGFVVTFDDGYLDNWVHAFPVLKKLAVKATIYLVTERIENHAAARPLGTALDTRTREREPGGFLSWAEAREMAASGLVEFGSHTHTHRGFVRKQKYSDLEQELRLSKQLIETELKRPCAQLAWPWGDYENEWQGLVAGLGFHSAMTTQAGANMNGTSPYRLKRINVTHPEVPWLAGRVRWASHAIAARGFGWMYGWDRRFKTWLHAESPYSHG
jgi:peptidoglycan/xylan/chitin deacetylase (PgdA/CDA1 family)